MATAVTTAIQEIINGLTLGSMYALVALGYTMIFGVLELIAFAQGGVYMIGAFAGLFAAERLQVAWPLRLIGAVVAAAAIGAVLNMTVDRIAYRPIRNVRRLLPLVSGLGAYEVLQNSAAIWIGVQPRPYPNVFPNGAWVSGGLVVTYAQVVVVAVGFVLMAALTWLVTQTRTGLAMRAAAEKPEVARLMGIETERIILITFMFAGLLAGAAGVLVGSYLGIATVTMGFGIGIKAFAAAVIGGIGNIPGAVLGGLSIGVVESFAQGYGASAWSDAVVFGVLIATLVLRPQGLLGTRIRERA